MIWFLLSRKWSLTTSQSASRTCARCELCKQEICLKKQWTCLLKALFLYTVCQFTQLFRMVKRCESTFISFIVPMLQGLNLAFIDPVLITQKAWEFGCGLSNFDKLRSSTFMNMMSKMKYNVPVCEWNYLFGYEYKDTVRWSMMSYV